MLNPDPNQIPPTTVGHLLAEPMRLPSAGRRRFVLYCIAFAIFFLITAACQWRQHAFENDFGTNPDEAAHYVTGLWCHDLLHNRGYLHPMRAAEEFYLHYPKLAIGHWGPTFYLLQGAWEQAFGTSRASVLLLQAATTGLLATLVYRLARHWTNGWIAFLCGTFVILSPIVQQGTVCVMSEPLGALLAFAAVLCWGRFLDNERAGWSLAFGVLASLAILAKGTGLMVGLVPPLAILLLKRPTFLNWRFWLPVPIVLVTCLPWYLKTLDMQRNGMASESFSLQFVQSAFSFYLVAACGVVGWVMLVLAAVGIVNWKLACGDPSRGAGVPASMLSLIIAALGFHILVPCGQQERFLTVIVAPVAFFGSLGIETLIRRTKGFRAGRAIGISAAALLLVGAIAFRADEFRAERVGGYAAMVDELIAEFPQKRAGFLVSSDPIGDGMFVAAIAMRDDRPDRFAIRGSKALASSRWDGRNRRLLFDTPEAVSDWLRQTPVALVVLDESVDPAALPEHQQLQDVIRSHPERWKLWKEFPLVRENRTFPAGLRVYRQLGLSSYTIDSLKIRMDEMLGRTLSSDEPPSPPKAASAAHHQ